MPELVSCVLCNISCEKGYITIEKNLTGEETLFLDVCLNCFNHGADSTLVNQVTYRRIESFKCVYCKDALENDMGEIIRDHSNATGKFCAVWLRSSCYIFMHPHCYEENIGL